MPTLERISMIQAINSFGQYTEWLTTGYVWDANGSVIAVSPQVEMADLPGGGAGSPNLTIKHFK